MERDRDGEGEGKIGVERGRGGGGVVTDINTQTDRDILSRFSDII